VKKDKSVSLGATLNQSKKNLKRKTFRERFLKLKKKFEKFFVMKVMDEE